ncbi:hypothetical protein BGY98DRAFT_999761 [Russula aff. rugulosa BPL654]|nr:hypothetical protein BGY98DRAFT_999761 [Russula aff. rugulosa BPL654]
MKSQPCAARPPIILPILAMPREGEGHTPLYCILYFLLLIAFLPCHPPGSETCERCIGWDGLARCFAVAPLDLLLPDHHQAAKKKKRGTHVTV